MTQLNRHVVGLLLLQSVVAPLVLLPKHVDTLGVVHPLRGAVAWHRFMHSGRAHFHVCCPLLLVVLTPRCGDLFGREAVG